MTPDTAGNGFARLWNALSSRQAAAVAAIIFMTFALASAFRQEAPIGSVTGKVFANDSDRLISGARITLAPVSNTNSEDEADLPKTRNVRSGSDGAFSVSHVPAGDYTISAVSRAHSIANVPITVTEGGVTQARIALNRSQTELEIKLHQRIFGTAESPHLSVSGYADEKKDAGTDVMRVRLWKTRLSFVLKDAAGAAALDKVGASYDPIPNLPDELLHPANSPAPKPLATREVKIKDYPEGFFYQTVDFSELNLAGVSTGLYLMDITHQKHTVCAWLLVTDTALVVKRADNRLLAFAVDMQTGAPLSGSVIRAYQSGSVVAQQAADGQGMANLNLPKSATTGDGEGGADSQHVTLVALRGEDEAVVNQNYYRNENGGEFTVHTYTDRPIYRPGQHIYFKSIVRKQTGQSADTQARYAVPAGQTVDVELRDPSGERIFKQELRTNAYGSISGGVDIHPESATGVYTFKMNISGEEHTHDVVIASYRKPEFAVTVTPDKKRYAQGETVRMTISGQYYFGAPVAGAKVKYRVFSTPDYSSDYAGDEEDSSDSEGDSEGSRRRYGEYYGGAVTDGETRLDENGKAVITFSSDNPERPKFMQQAENYTTTVTVTEGENRESEADGTALITPGEFRLSAAPEGYVAAPGKTTAVILAARDYDNKPVAGLPVEVETGYQTWKKDGGLIFKRTGVQHATLGPDGRSRIEVTPPHAGEFIVKLRAHDRQNHLLVARGTLYAADDSGGDLDTEYADLTLLTDKRRYQAGETARVLINAARTGETVLLTIEGERLYAQQAVPMPQKSHVLYIPIRKEYGPNVFLAACYVQKKHFAQSSVGLHVATPQQELKVQITADRETTPGSQTADSGSQPVLAKYQPGDTITYHIQTTDAKGNPAPCELSFGVVDESIYALKEDDPTALRDDFYPRRSNAVSTEYSFAIQYLGDADKSEPKITARKKFPDTAFWNPHLRTDSQGRSAVSFALPDSLTTWRATATAHTLDTRLGRAIDKVISTKDFLVRLQTPRFLTQKDQSEVVAFVHNETGKAQTATVHLTADNLSVSGQAVQTIPLNAGQIGQVKWPVTADKYGSAKLTVKAWTSKEPAGTQYTDGLEIPLPIRPHGREEVQGFAGQLTAANPETEVIRLDPNAVPGLSHLTVRITPSIASSLVGATDYLIGFPYGCTEQTMSRFLPDLLVQRALHLNGIQNVGQAAELPRMVRDGLQRLYRFQHAETGGWGWWEHDTDNPWMTAYVLYGLSTAKAQGYPVSENVLAKGRKAAAKMAADVKTDLSDRAFLIYALALAGDQKTAQTERNRPIALKKFRTDALAYMTLLDSLLGKPDSAVLAELNRRAILRDGMLHWKNQQDAQGDWNDLGTTAIALRALLAANRQESRINPILSWLMFQRNGAYWSSTRDTSLILAAFCDYLQTGPAFSATGEVRVKVNGALYQTFTLTPDLLKEKEVSLRIPASVLRPEKNDVTLERADGSSPIFYSVQMHQTVAAGELPALPNPQLSIKREYLRAVPRQAGSGYYTLQTEPTNNILNAGDHIRVRLTITAQRDLSYVLIEDAYPAGCDINERGDADDVAEWGYWWSSIDVRDDRIAFFARSLTRGEHIIEYNLRAETPGTYHVLPTLAQGMYAPETRAESAETPVTVR